MIKLGITGGIGSGKSYVSQLLEQRGVPVFDCDSRAKQLTVSHPAIRKGLVELLGPEVYKQDDVLNKPLLASYLFASEENASRVNAIIHPCVRAAFKQWVKEQASQDIRIVAMESAILYESGFQNEVDEVLAVHAPLDVRCQRVVLRDHTTIEAVEKRIAAQMSDEKKCEMADFVIENDGICSLKDQLDKLFSLLETRKEDK